MTARFLQIHTLTSYPASLLNRDDAGMAKRLPFGGAIRTRVSSQSLKRHWRTHEGPHALSEIRDLAVRSRQSFERFVVQPLLEAHPDRERVVPVVEALMAEVLGQSAKAKDSAKAEAKGALNTAQVTVLGRAELSYLKNLAHEILQSQDAGKPAEAVKNALTKDVKKNLKSVGMAGLDAALFGRMVTGDLLAQTDAAIHVAHAFTVHAEASEPDYFSAVDDLEAAEGGLGSGHINSTELTTGLFYGYVAVDVPLLVSNLTGTPAQAWDTAQREDAARVVDHLIRLVATVSPGAKLGSTAPHAYAQMMLVEAGAALPRTLANAFLKPVRPQPDLLNNAYGALTAHLSDLDAAYGAEAARAHLVLGATEPLAGLGDKVDLNRLAQWAADQVRA